MPKRSSSPSAKRTCNRVKTFFPSGSKSWGAKVSSSELSSLEAFTWRYFGGDLDDDERDGSSLGEDGDLMRKERFFFLIIPCSFCSFLSSF